MFQRSFYISEPFVESIPQTHIMMTLLFIFNPDKMAQLGGEDNNLVTQHTPLDGADLITLKFILSVLTSSFGIANFLARGPFRAISKDGHCDGYLKGSFFTILFASSLWMVGKPFWLVPALLKFNADKHFIPIINIIWIGFSLILQGIVVCKIL